MHLSPIQKVTSAFVRWKYILETKIGIARVNVFKATQNCKIIDRQRGSWVIFQSFQLSVPHIFAGKAQCFLLLFKLLLCSLY